MKLRERRGHHISTGSQILVYIGLPCPALSQISFVTDLSFLRPRKLLKGVALSLRATKVLALFEPPGDVSNLKIFRKVNGLIVRVPLPVNLIVN